MAGYERLELGFKWFIVTTLGLIASSFLYGHVACLIWPCFEPPPGVVFSQILIRDPILHSLLLGIITGVCLGGLELIVLRQHAADAYLWMGASVVGWSVGFSLGSALYQLAGPDLYSLVLELPGATVGIVQWIYLRRHFRRSGLWVVARCVSTLFVDSGVLVTGFLMAVAVMIVMPGSLNGFRASMPDEMNEFRT
jgi:hypothetical protein